MQAKALLFDTRSIQRYIYSGNLLKTNIGASYLVDRVFEDVLAGEILEEEFPGEVDTERRASKERVDWSALDKKCTVAYIGGGNALILFRMDTEDGVQKNIVQKISRRLLSSHPGLRIGAAFGTLEISSPEAFQRGIDALYERLKKTQATVFPKVNVPYTGLTLSCPVNGEAANFCDTKGLMGDKGGKGDGPRFFSQEARAKTEAEETASKQLREKFEKLFKGTEAENLFPAYAFPRALDELGQKRDEARSNYIAIVHIDGNNMGKKFRLLCKDLEDRRILAEEIRRKTESSFAALLQWILKQCEDGAYKEELDLKPKRKGSSVPEQKKILPIRPLILGGDDVTFICPAKTALVFTKYFMETLLADVSDETQEIRRPEARRMDSCAGIAILPTSYPFFRGYELAEQLCDAAKQSMRRLLKEIPKEEEKAAAAEDLRGTSWLDFAILHGEQAPTLEQIRAREYTGARGPMHFGPYQVGNADAKKTADRVHNIENLIDAARRLLKGANDAGNAPSVIPKSKIKELRRVLQAGEDEAGRFLAQMARMGQRLPQIDDWKSYEDSLWHNGRTPYTDAIEMMDFIPEEA